MNEIGYLIRYCPYIWEENAEGEMYHQHFDTIDEFYTNECEFNERIKKLSNDWYVGSNGRIYDGVDIIDLYSCELHRIN